MSGRMRALAALVAVAAVLPAACGLAGEARVQLVAATGSSGATTTAKECGACHMAYAPQMLPARSWSKLLSHLGSHFGEDASLAEPTRAAVLAYLTAHAADSRDGSRGVMAGLTVADSPERITDMPFWRRRHGRLLRPGVGEGPGIRSAANCVSCHNGSGGGGDD